MKLTAPSGWPQAPRRCTSDASRLDPLAGLWLCGAGGDLLHGRGERVQAVQARPALTGALAGEPARDAGRLRDRAGLLGEQQDDARSERGTVRREIFIRQGETAQELPSIQVPA